MRRRAGSGGVHGHILEILEAVIQHGSGIRVNLRSIGAQGDAYQPPSVPLREGHQSIQRGLGESGFPSCTSIVGIGTFRKHFVVVIEPALLSAHVGFGDHIGLRLAYLAEQRMAVGCLGDQRHIMGRGIMILVRQPVGVGEMGVGAAKLGGPLIHQFHKSVYTAADVFCHCQADLIGGLQHHAVKTFLHGKDFPHPDTDVGTVPFNAVNGVFRECYPLIQGRIFYGKKGGHHFGDAGGVFNRVHVF